MSVWHDTNLRRTEKPTGLLAGTFGLTTSNEFIRAFVIFLHMSFTTKTKFNPSQLRLSGINCNLEKSDD